MKKRLVGGMILLNLCAISLSVNGGEVDITNEDIKSQLLELRNFIDEKRDFTKGAKDLKPVLVQYRSSVSKIDGVVQCNMGFYNDALHLSIGGTAVLSNGDKLTININVEYQYTDYVGYTIKTAKLKVLLSNETICHISMDENDKLIAFFDVEKIDVGQYVSIKHESGVDISSFAIGRVVDASNDVVKILTTPFAVYDSTDDSPINACEIYIDENNDVTLCDNLSNNISIGDFESLEIFAI